MASFKQSPDEWQRLDWRLLHNSPIALYYHAPVLEADISWFTEHGYRVLSLRADERKDPTELLASLGEILKFPEYYGRTLDAFNDCLSDVDVPDAGGLVLVLRRFDTFAHANPSFAQAVLDICANNSRRFLMTGRRFLVLVQSDDPRIAFEPVGASQIAWNPQEWLDSKRGLVTDSEKNGAAARNLSSIRPSFIVKDLPTSIAYYRERLGFQLDFQGPDDTPFWAGVSRDGIGIMLKEVAPDVPPMPNQSRHEWAPHDALIYSMNPEALYEEFTRRGATFAKPLSFVDEGLWGFAIADADGYVITFFQLRSE